MKGLKIEVSGRVQGVGFRYFTVYQANEHRIRGSVQNLPNGKVKIIAFGEDDDINKFLSAVRNGPSFAFVSDVKIRELAIENVPKRFKVEY